MPIYLLLFWLLSCYDICIRHYFLHYSNQGETASTCIQPHLTHHGLQSRQLGHRCPQRSRLVITYTPSHKEHIVGVQCTFSEMSSGVCCQQHMLLYVAAHSEQTQKYSGLVSHGLDKIHSGVPTATGRQLLA